MSSFALYRLPHEDHCVLLAQENGHPLELSSFAELNGKEGFVIAPFSVSDDEPVLLLVPDRSERLLIRDAGELICNEMAATDMSADDAEVARRNYSDDYQKFSQQIRNGELCKIVLSRCKVMKSETEIAPEDLFEYACKLYPRMFVALVHTERCGTWLTASPEILLEGGERHWRTIALAGTMKLEGRMLDFDSSPDKSDEKNIHWSDKNIKEQRFVATYINNRLEQFSQNVAEEGPFTVRAGDLVHLRSNFDFTLHTTENLGELIDMLHPTPAVCGLPKEKARQFILSNECHKRHYYSGFMGPLNPSGKTHLYVSLRCMKMEGTRYELYAGGGLVTDSNEASEWNETEAKMETMKKCLAIKKI